MICLLLIMTMIFINSTETAEQKVRHSETLLKEEDMNARTKAWLLMVESGKGDQEEFRRITPKSIFIAPLLTSRTGKCKEGYRHDHLGQCVKVIKIEPKVQLELLLQRLNKLYGEKNEEKSEEEEEEVESELFEVSNGPLHFSLPISNEKADPNRGVKPEAANITMVNVTTPEVQNIPEFIPIPLPMVYLNHTKEIESSGAEPLNETETHEAEQLEGSGEGQTASGDGLQEEESTTLSPVGLISEETDYFDVTESEATTVTETQSSTEPPMKESKITKAEIKEELGKSYQNITDSINNSSTISPKGSIQGEITIKNNDSEKIYFPSDDNYDNGLRTPVQSSAPSSSSSSRIRFPDETSQEQVPSYQPDSSSTSTKYHIQPSAIPREQFWWLPKNWKIDENQHKSALVKVWSRLPLMHDTSHSPDSGFRKSPNEPEMFNPDEGRFYLSPNHQRRVVKPFKSSRFQDVILTPRQNFRFQR